jgi:CRP/FNR family transcriptional regulator, cyclic AMP receptor protein
MDSLHDALCTTLRDGLGWPAETAVQAAQYAHIVSYEKNASVFHAGESTDLLYVLLSGEVRLYYGTATGERLLVTIIRNGQPFGCTDLQTSDAGSRPQEQLFTARTLSRSKVAIIARARVVQLLHDLPGRDLVRIIQTADAGWERLSCRLLTFMTQDVRSRLASTIGEMAKVFGIADARGKLLSLRLSHEDFAELVGASRPMVSKHLKELAACGIFVKENGRYVVLREDVLRDIAVSGRRAAVEPLRPQAAHPEPRVARAAQSAQPISITMSKKRHNAARPVSKKAEQPLRYIA